MSDPNATQKPENQTLTDSSVDQENPDREENETSGNDFQESTEQSEIGEELNEAFESEIEALDQLSSEDHFDELNELAALDGADSELLSVESEESTEVSEAQSDMQSNDESDSDINIDPAVHDDVDLGEEVLPEVKEKGDPYGGHEHEALKRILEAALFASGTTLSVSHLGDIFDKLERPHSRMIRQLMAELIAAYENRGVRVIEVASGYRFQTVEETAHWISRLWEEKPQRYSRALMETIALIAYRQPITRGEIEDVRGVAVSSNIVRTLLEREWVRVVGHRDVPGRPAMYATTRQFLDYFGL
jgi:segregation and condensation protein B